MSGKHQIAIRQLLRQCDGLTVVEIRDQLGLKGKPGSTTVSYALDAMPDAYIDRWVPAKVQGWAAVWCVIEKPANCPKPE